MKISGAIMLWDLPHERNSSEAADEQRADFNFNFLLLFFEPNRLSCSRNESIVY